MCHCQIGFFAGVRQPLFSNESKVKYFGNKLQKFLIARGFKSTDLALKIVKIGMWEDGNPGEILENIGEELGICYCCAKKSDEFKEGLCKDCASEYS